jgi:phosphocarrier protein FPr
VVAARARIARQAGDAEAAIFDAHLLLLDDAALLGPAKDAIDGGRSAAAAWADAARAAADGYRALDDPYLQERAADVEDVGARVLRHLTGAPAPAAMADAGVLVVADLTPGDAAGLDRDLVRGLAVARGGATSHAAILARALGIPAVVGLGDAVLAVPDGALLVVDGAAGTVEVDPPPETVAERERERAAAQERVARARERAREPARMRDGETLEVAANLGSAAEAAAAAALGADGVGLLRTEFLFLDRDDAPSEEEQRAVYAEIAAALAGRPVVVRTLDAGADKPLPFLRQPPEDNPFLGVRGIRLGLANEELLRTQLRAILAVAMEHPVKVMFPMVATLDEYRAARALLESERAALGAPEIEVGVMVEVPAVALQADRFAAEVDFFSVGTNDLTQYTMAAERGNERLAGLLDGLRPPVLELIAATARAAAAHGRWTGVCGELAGDPEAAVVLAGLGVRELSMAASRIAEVKDALRAVTLAEAQDAAVRALGR